MRHRRLPWLRRRYLSRRIPLNVGKGPFLQAIECWLFGQINKPYHRLLI